MTIQVGGTTVIDDSRNLTNIASAVVTGSLTVDTNTLAVDAVNNRVGVGTATPTYTLDILGPPGDTTVRVKAVSSGVDLDDDATLILDSTGTGDSLLSLRSENVEKAYIEVLNGGVDLTVGTNGGLAGGITFVPNGNTAMTMTDTGFIGVGTTNPLNKFVVSNGGAEGLEIDPVNTDQQVTVLAYDRTALNYHTLRTNAAQHLWSIGGSERLRLGPGGQLGLNGANYGSAGEVLKSTGASTPPVWGGSATLLGTLATTAGATQTLSGLDLTGYTLVYVVFNSVSGTSASSHLRIAALQVTDNTSSSTELFHGIATIDLSTGKFTSVAASSASTPPVSFLGNTYVGDTNIINSTTSIAFSLNSGTFDAGSIRVYGI